MERPSGKTKLLNFILMLLFLALIGSAYMTQEKNFIAQIYTGKIQENVNIVILGEPVLIVTYDDEKKLVSLDTYTPPKQKKNVKNPPVFTDYELAQKALEAKKLSTKNVKYMAPAKKDSEAAWEKFKTIISCWRYNPLLVTGYLYSYSKAFLTKQTNIYPYEFLLLNLKGINLEMTDFLFKLDPVQTRAVLRGAAQAQTAAGARALPVLEEENRPLIVEIYNASGRKGAALELTQYLRSLNEKGLLNVDVLQYDNYHKNEDKSQVVNITGRVKEVKQLSVALGMRDNELFNEPNPSAFCDAKIIIGKNFKMP
ncbi:hypothetical protein Dip510_001956 [Elusimicrobium posterum]|uniref:LytR C-terminal domain-containing protein n=1 Tax=Elusimicrobium posterum TaxID=3116653 RepID=UPI003C75ED76